MSFPKLQNWTDVKGYAVETHFHTNGVSGCAQNTVEQAIDQLVSKGFSTGIITNHYNEWYLQERTAKELVDMHYNEWVKAKEYGEKKGITILHGVEFNPPHSGDYLMYGFDWNFLYDHAEFIKMPLEEYYPIAHENGVLIIQAHPFRYEEIPWDINYLDGYECYNGGNDIELNTRAYNHLKTLGGIKTSGSDFHHPGQLGRGGMIFDHPINTMDEFIAGLKSGNYKLLCDDEFLERFSCDR
jgi:hypothetical protein